MNDRFIDDLLDQDIPQPDSEVRKRAITLAVSEFSQGFEESSRPIDDEQPSSWSHLMSFLRNPNTGRVFATVAVAFVAVSLIYLLPTDYEVQNSETVADDTQDVAAERSVDIPDSVSAQPEASEITSTSKVIRPQPTTDQSQDESPESDDVVAVQSEPSPPAEPLDHYTQTGKDHISKAPLSLGQAEPQETGLEEIVTTGTRVTQNEPEVAPNAPPPPAAAGPGDNAQAAATLAITDQRNGQPAHSPAMPKPAPEPNISGRIETERQNVRQRRVDGISESALPAVLEEITVTAVKLNDADYGQLQESRPDLREEYAEHEENTVKLVSEHPVSTFSIDVDTASYALVRNQLERGYLPAPTAVRTEEIINYFNYDYELPRSKKRPFEPSLTVFDSPWNEGKKLVHIGIQGYQIPKSKAPDSNLVFLLDVSGSMSSQNKLPLVKQSIGLLLESLKPTDTVSIVVYAGAAGTVLEPTKVKDKSKILAALQNLHAGGSTAGAQGIELAYQTAELNFDKKAVNRIILATDGDFNVGQHSNKALQSLVERKRDKGVFLSVLGFGRNNYQDDMMQTLAQNGNGVAAYIDSLSEAKKVLVDEATSSLFTIAKDVKIQIEFNAATVSEYRLVGYETRKLNREDFNNDKVDAGDIGAGHSVTAIYEITPADSKNKSIDELRYAENKKTQARSDQSGEYGFLKIRYKLPKGKKSRLIELPITVQSGKADQDVLFSTAAAGFAQLLKGGKYTGDLSYDDVITMAQSNKGQDPFGYRGEFIQLVQMAKIAKP